MGVHKLQLVAPLVSASLYTLFYDVIISTWMIVHVLITGAVLVVRQPFIYLLSFARSFSTAFLTATPSPVPTFGLI